MGSTVGGGRSAINGGGALWHPKSFRTPSPCPPTLTPGLYLRPSPDQALKVPVSHRW